MFLFRWMKSSSGKTSGNMKNWISIGVRILAPILVFGYAYSLIAPPMRALFSGLATSGAKFAGLNSIVISSAPVCLLLALCLFAIIGYSFTTRIGHRVIGFFDRLLCKISFYESMRGLIKLPSFESGPSKDNAIVWAWTANGYSLAVVKDVTEYPNGGPVMMSLMFLSAPLPTSWSVSRVNKLWTADAGLDFAAWLTWKEKGGGALPIGAIEAPSTPPAAFCGGVVSH